MKVNECEKKSMSLINCFVNKQALYKRFLFDYLHIYGISWGINFDSIYPPLRSHSCCDIKKIWNVYVCGAKGYRERTKQVRMAFTVIEGEYYIVRWIKSNLWWLLFRLYVAFKIPPPPDSFLFHFINWQWIKWN